MLNRVRWRHRALALAATAIAACSAAALAPASPARADIVRNTELWVLNELNMQSAWTVTQGKGVLVAVIDSGVDPNVTDLVGNVLTGPNLSGVGTSPSNPNWGVHGTWMASLVAGHGNGPADSSGIIGTAPQSKVLSIRVITDVGDPHDAAYEHEPAAVGQSELAQAITYAVAHHVQVISMSLGYSQQSRPVRAALQDAYEHNVVVVASAGNAGELTGRPDGTPSAPSAYSFPANYPGVLGVAAVDNAGQVASFSSQNLSVQVAAPGYKVPAQGRDGQYWYVSGTSPACALTAGVVALIKSAYPHLTDSQVISAITSSTTASTRPPGGYDDQIGFGVVDAYAALKAAGKLAGAPPAPAGMALTRHFGGGLAAIPAAPVPPRGPTGLALYCLLGAACLAVVAIATSRLLTQRDTAAAVPPGPGQPGSAGQLSGPAEPQATRVGPSAAGRPQAGPPQAGPPMGGPPVGGPPMGGPLTGGPRVADPPVIDPPVAGPPVAGPPVAGPPAASQPEVGRPPASPWMAGDEAPPAARHAAPRSRGHHWPGPS